MKERYFNLNRLRDILLSFALLVLVIGWSDTLRTDTPAGTDDPREADDRMREKAAAFVERHNIDHYFPASATSTYDHADCGMHRYITFQGPNTTPATIAENQARLYTKDVSSKAELHWIDEDENGLQLTSDGALLLTGARIPNDTYIKAIDAAGTGTVNLIKADANNIVTLPENTILTAGVTPDANDEIVNKKYVDDQLDDAFGSWVSKSNNTVYQATTAGLVCAYAYGNKDLNGWTDGSTPPATLRIRSHQNETAHNITFPVKKNDYWKVTDADVIFWIPIGG